MSVASGLQESRSRELAEIEFLRAENERLQQDLDECKSKLLQVFREEGQATDSDIQNDFERLSNAVEAWVDLVLDQHAVSFRKEWEKVMQQTHLRKDAPGIVEFLRDAFPSGFGPGDAMGWLGAQKSADCLIVSIVVWQVLEQIFRRRWPVGTNDNRAKRKDQGYDRRSILDNVQNAMLNEGNRKGTLFAQYNIRLCRSNKDSRPIFQSDMVEI